jgi:hypothetical protein
LVGRRLRKLQSAFTVAVGFCTDKPIKCLLQWQSSACISFCHSVVDCATLKLSQNEMTFMMMSYSVT